MSILLTCTIYNQSCQQHWSKLMTRGPHNLRIRLFFCPRFILYSELHCWLIKSMASYLQIFGRFRPVFLKWYSPSLLHGRSGSIPIVSVQHQAQVPFHISDRPQPLPRCYVTDQFTPFSHTIINLNHITTRWRCRQHVLPKRRNALMVLYSAITLKTINFNENSQ
jgi:hypothetical protein